MPAESKNQQQAAGMALAAKRGKMAISKLKGAAKRMAESMSVEQLKHYAQTARKALPTRVGEKKATQESYDMNAGQEVSDAVKQAYWEGFAVKCAEAGIDPEELAKSAAGINWQAIMPFLQRHGASALRGAKAFGSGAASGFDDIVQLLRGAAPGSRASADLGGKSLKAWQAGNLAVPTAIGGSVFAVPFGLGRRSKRGPVPRQVDTDQE